MNLHGLALECQWWGKLNRQTLPIVLLHEGLGSVSRWRDFPAVLADETHRAVFAFSRLGHGQSDPPAKPHSTRFMHEEAWLLPSILATAGIARTIVLGHSDGGSIALMFAANHPERVDCLVLEAPHVFVEDLSIASIEQTTRRYHEGDLRSRLLRHHKHVDVAFHGWSDVWLDPAFRHWNIEEYLPRVTCPILLIQGIDDEYGTLRQLDAIEAQVRGPVERLVLQECGHAPHRDQRLDVLNAVKKFVSSRD